MRHATPILVNIVIMNDYMGQKDGIHNEESWGRGYKILNDFYQQLIKLCISENRKIKDPNPDCGKLYYDTKIPMSEDRQFNIRWVKLPTFTRENKQQYYTVFINDIDYWRAGEKKQIYGQIIETLDRHDVDSYTIFQFGKYHGHIDPIINELIKYYHIYVINTQEPQNKNIEMIYKFISNFLQRRINGRKGNTIIFGDLLVEIKRLQSFVDFLNSMNLSFSYIISNDSKKNSFYKPSNIREGGGKT